VQFELTKGTREAVAALIKLGNLHSKDYLFKSRVGSCQHISTRQYNRIFHGWVAKLGLDDSLYSTVRYLGIKVDDALEISESIEA